MHRLEDIRITENDWSLTVYVSEVDASGNATNLERMDTYDEGLPQPVSPFGSAPYYCSACGHEFSSWEEAKLHILDPDQ
jgi:hypothetical protein